MRNKRSLEGVVDSWGGVEVGLRVYKFKMGGCQNYGPFLGPYYNTAPII